jgi:hypothetical protein
MLSAEILLYSYISNIMSLWRTFIHYLLTVCWFYTRVE